MKVTAIRSDGIYRRMIAAAKEKRDDIYRYEIMKPFEYKWSCIHVPIKAAKKSGYDVVMASEMMGFLPPSDVDERWGKGIDLISTETFWQSCQTAIERSLGCFLDTGVALPVKEYLYTIVLANPDSPYTKMSNGYCGDGGIPGYILGSLVPNEYTISRIPAALAHECNHNVRFQFIKWSNDVTLADMMVCEGLAENFAVMMYGEDKLGPWVSKTDMETLNTYIKSIIKGGLNTTGFDNITAYLYGDETAKLRGYFPVGLPYCAGYACGYYMIKYYLKKTGMSITDATLTKTQDIMAEIEDFWNEQS